MPVRSFANTQKAGVTHVICMVNFGGVTMPDVRRTLELMSKEGVAKFSLAGAHDPQQWLATSLEVAVRTCLFFYHPFANHVAESGDSRRKSFL